ncbi:MAG: LysR family transcriptional regulator [Emcibacteraceae bacterium]|nr:LysR family transcriptional regulator [Emcibacteraceae bacterium]
MDHLSRIGIFIAVVKNQSFARAARELGITSSAVSKQVQNLEHELQVKLLNRTTRKVAPTEEGAIFFERATRALEDLQEAREQVHELKSNPKGALKVSIPHSLGINYLAKGIAAFAKKYPDIHLDLNFDDRIVDMVSEGFDLVVRISDLQDSSLISRRLASCPITICASPEYLKTHGDLKTPEDLAKHNVLAYTRNTGLHEWRYKTPEGKNGQVSLKGTFKSDTGQMMCEAAFQGIGIAILPIFYVADHLKSGALIKILPDYKTWPDRNIHAVFMPNRYLSTRLRLFVDHLATICKTLPW